jgi:hypothetical protein
MSLPSSPKADEPAARVSWRCDESALLPVFRSLPLPRPFLLGDRKTPRSQAFHFGVARLCQVERLLWELASGQAQAADYPLVFFPAPLRCVAIVIFRQPPSPRASSQRGEPCAG